MAAVQIPEILIPRFFEGEEFYASTAGGALRNCQNRGFEAVFMPELIDARIAAAKEARVWQTWFTAPSIRATGRSKGGNPVVVYAHVPNYLCNPDNIDGANNKGLVNAGMLPENEFKRLLDLQDDDAVFVIDYSALKNSESDLIDLKNALRHPQTIPFLGGRERAERYLDKHNEVYGDKIGVWHSDDLDEQPLARLLVVGHDLYYGLYGFSSINYDACFVGVRSLKRARSAEKIPRPTLEQLLSLSKDFVPNVAMPEYKQRLNAIYE